jgi:hypothetical protein
VLIVFLHHFFADAFLRSFHFAGTRLIPTTTGPDAGLKEALRKSMNVSASNKKRR